MNKILKQFEQATEEAKKMIEQGYEVTIHSNPQGDGFCITATKDFNLIPDGITR